MILVDTSIWVDPLRSGHGLLTRLLNDGKVLGHSWVLGELGLGHLGARDEIIRLYRGLPQATTATDDEVMTLIDQQGLTGTGIGWVDAHLLASTRLTVDASLWTTDQRMAAVAERLGMAANPAAK